MALKARNMFSYSVKGKGNYPDAETYCAAEVYQF
jgi:hypothetical protein